MIVDEEDLKNHFDYIHFNPIKHGYVAQAVDWLYSLLHRYVDSGELPEDWARDPGAGIRRA